MKYKMKHKSREHIPFIKPHILQNKPLVLFLLTTLFLILLMVPLNNPPPTYSINDLFQNFFKYAIPSNNCSFPSNTNYKISSDGNSTSDSYINNDTIIDVTNNLQLPTSTHLINRVNDSLQHLDQDNEPSRGHMTGPDITGPDPVTSLVNEENQELKHGTTSAPNAVVNPAKKRRRRRKKKKPKVVVTPTRNEEVKDETKLPRNEEVEDETKSLWNEEVEDETKCNIFIGEWVRNEEAPYYTNKTCWAIHDQQNCMKYGRPDTEFMKWKWKPKRCELPVFEPFEFLEIVRGKSLAFVGDSVARNQMQSLICLLSRVEYPIDITDTEDWRFKQLRYPTYNFTVAMFWSPLLVRVVDDAASGVTTRDGYLNIYLDELDTKWTTQIEEFNYVIISAGHWFARPSVYYERHRIRGCQYCNLNRVPYLPSTYAYRMAFRTAFKAINSLKNYNGTTILRTFSPSHFENGMWDRGANCVRTRPYNANEISLVGSNLEFYMTQVKEFMDAQREGEKKGLKFKLLDITRAMLLRPDGHPNRYGHWLNTSRVNDCVHWCLPGAIDAWNDFLLEMLKNMEDELVKAQKRPWLMDGL